MDDQVALGVFAVVYRPEAPAVAGIDWPDAAGAHPTTTRKKDAWRIHRPRWPGKLESSSMAPPDDERRAYEEAMGGARPLPADPKRIREPLPSRPAPSPAPRRSAGPPA